MHRRDELMAILDKHCENENNKSESCTCKSAYDFVYLPMDFMYVNLTFWSFAVHFVHTIVSYSFLFLYLFLLIQFCWMCFVGSLGINEKFQIWDMPLWISRTLLLHSNFLTPFTNVYGMFQKTAKLAKLLLLSFRFVNHASILCHPQHNFIYALSLRWIVWSFNSWSCMCSCMVLLISCTGPGS